jgi:rhamnogalacturonyl hydrolase YesR
MNSQPPLNARHRPVQGNEPISTALELVQSWVEDRNYRGYEPFDGLSSWFRPLAMGNIFAERLLMQAIRQSPINLRPFMGVKPKDSTKGRGYMAWGYLYLHKATGDAEFLRKAESCLDWLDENKVPRFENHSWSNHFDFSSRGGRYTKHDPIIVWTSLIGQTYLEAFEQTKNMRWLTIADSISRWILALPREKTGTGDCLSYLSHVQSSIHNANMLGAAMLARTARHTGNTLCREVARSAVEYSCSRQLADGSWWYAEDPKYHWIDNFHTGYNLDSLKCFIDNTGDRTWEQNMRKGLDFFKSHFIESNGRPRYYHDRTYPVDSQCAGQSIETLATFSSIDPDCLSLSTKVAEWTIKNMQDPDGHFHYRHYPWGKARTPMLHWSQTTIFKGLAVLYYELENTAHRIP